jgi:pimeloyl-ACP methyl ester carboxylesterase
VNEHWFEAGGARVHAVIWGSGERRVLLVHGLGGNTVNWEAWAPLLADAVDAKVLAVDLPGFGLTRVPADQRATIGFHGRVLRDLLTRIGPSPVVGNSMGGALAVGLAARHPDLVRALVLVNPALPRPGAHPSQWLFMARLAPMLVPPIGAQVLATRARILGPERLVDTTLEWTLSDPARIDPAIRRRLIDLAATRRGFPEAARAFAESARSLFWYLNQRMRGDLARVTSPAHIVHGEHDRLVPVAAARALAQQRPEFTLDVLADCGHAPQLEMPEELVRRVAPRLFDALTPA